MLKSLSKNENAFWVSYKKDTLEGINKAIQDNHLMAAGKLLFTALDAMGLFYKGAFTKGNKWFVLPGGSRNPRSTTEEQSGSKDCFCNYIKNCWPVKMNPNFCKEKIYEIYRCGLLHEGRPKNNYKLSNNIIFFTGKTLSIKKCYGLFLESINNFEEYLDIIIQTLKETSSEYDKLLRELKERVVPKVILFKYKDKENFGEESIKNKYL